MNTTTKPQIIHGTPRGDWRQIIAANFKREQEKSSTTKELKS